MPKFHLHIRDGDAMIRDEEGQEFVDAAEARVEAEAAVREILATVLTGNPPRFIRTIQLADDEGKVVVTISMKVETTITEPP